MGRRAIRQGSFRGETPENAVPIVEKLPGHIRTALIPIVKVFKNTL